MASTSSSSKSKKNTTSSPPADAGVLQQHRYRMENDSEYREAVLTAPIGVRGKYLTNTAPTVMAADRDKDAKTHERTHAQRDGHAIADKSLADQS